MNQNYSYTANHSDNGFPNLNFNRPTTYFVPYFIGGPDFQSNLETSSYENSNSRNTPVIRKDVTNVRAPQTRKTNQTTLWIIIGVVGVVILLAILIPVIIYVVNLNKTTNPTTGCSTGYLHYCNATGACIYPSQMCDRYQDCPDDFDESNCTCDTTFQYACSNGRCIYKEYVCDGVVDCPSGDDETGCVQCTSTQFKCKKSNQCVDAQYRCDGAVQCADMSDEDACLSLSPSNIVMAMYQSNDVNYEVCGDEYDPSWNNILCNIAGYDMPISQTFTPALNDTKYLSISDIDTNTSISIVTFASDSNCSSLISLVCGLFTCGSRNLSSTPSYSSYIINGMAASKGAWPWFGMLLAGDSLCGSALISHRWVVTAGHCVPTLSSTHMTVTFGATQRSNDPQAKTYIVESSIRNPNFLITDNATAGDIALLKLKDSVVYNEYISPICLPGFNDSYDLRSKYKVCVSVGFGTTIKGEVSTFLEQSRMNIYDDSHCKDILTTYDNPDGYLKKLCIGSEPGLGLNNICFGDSGGPLSCKGDNNLWYLVGVHSYVFTKASDQSGFSSNDVRYCEVSMATRVWSYRDWILQIAV